MIILVCSLAEDSIHLVGIEAHYPAGQPQHRYDTCLRPTLHCARS